MISQSPLSDGRAEGLRDMPTEAVADVLLADEVVIDENCRMASEVGVLLHRRGNALNRR